MIGLTEQEAQLIEMLREWGGKEDYRMVIEVRDGVWDSTISRAPHGQDASVRGSGSSFNDPVRSEMILAHRPGQLGDVRRDEPTPHYGIQRGGQDLL
jgi:hypothetical protein